jgi:tetratricopeptide (TPR) repeat protein
MDAMRHVILSFEPKADLRDLDEAGMSNAYRSVLHDKRVLLFLDNARSAEQVAPLRPSETCALLVTSRWTFGVSGLKNRHVGVISQENAGKFLLELCPRIGDQADELARACGYLPLALRIAGSFLQVNEDWSVENYLAGLNDRKRRLATLEQSRTEAELTAEPDLLATFELSYSRLSEENKKCWRMLGVFPISFAWGAASAIWELGEDECRKLLGLFLRYSLLDYDETSFCYSLHDLLSDYALSQMDSEEEREARLKHASHYKLVLGFADYLYHQGGEELLTGLRLFDLEWDNIRAGQAWVSQNFADQDCLELCNEFPTAGSLILALRQHPRERLVWLEKALQAARKSGKKKDEGDHLGNLGLAYEALGEARKAIEFYEAWLAIAREIGDREDEGRALGNLGNAYAALGELRKAIEFYEQDLAITREFGDRRGEGNALGNLGGAYYRLGDDRKAIEFGEGHLAIALEIGDRLGEGTAIGNLGNAYYSLGEAHKAMEFYERHLALAHEIGDRNGEGRALFNMGMVLYDLGERDRGIQLVKGALEIFEAIESPIAEQARNMLEAWSTLPKEKGKSASWMDRIRQKLGKQ